MKKKMILNMQIALPAFIGSIMLLTYKNFLVTSALDTHHLPAISCLDIIRTLPYIATFYLALTGLDIIIVLVLGIILALGLGLLLQSLTTLAAINLLVDGFYNSKGMVNVFVLAILLLVTLVNITIAINTIAIIISGPIAKKIGDDFEIDNAETACILDIGSCVSQGLLPYTPQLLLAASMAQVSTISLLPYLYYQFLLGISLFITILWRKNKPIRK